MANRIKTQLPGGGETAVTPATSSTGATAGQPVALNNSALLDPSLGGVSGLSLGSVVFASASGTASQDNANLYWDASNKRLAIGSIPPSLVPAMTSNTTPSPMVASSYDGSSNAYLAMDGSQGTQYAAPQDGSNNFGWLQIDLGVETAIAGYYYQSVQYYDVGAWTITGSHDGSTWTTIDSESVGYPADSSYNYYLFSSPKTYRYFRFNASNAQYCRITEWRLLQASSVHASPTSKLYITPSVASEIGQVLSGVSGQTGDLTQWQNSTGTVLGKVTAAGAGQFSSLDGTPIGSNTVASGSFSTLSASSSATFAGTAAFNSAAYFAAGTTYKVDASGNAVFLSLNGTPIGATTASTGKFTTLTTTSTGTFGGSVGVTGSVTASTFLKTGGLQTAAAYKSAAYTVTSSDADFLCDATSAPFTMTLPSSPADGEIHEFIKYDSSANVVTIAGNGKNINSSTSVSLTTQWQVIKMKYFLTKTLWVVL